MPRFLIGADIGKAADYTALSVIEYRAKDKDVDSNLYEYHIRHLFRPSLGTPYPDVLEIINKLAEHPAVGSDSAVVVDATGVGAPIVDLLREKLPLLVAITITGGSNVNEQNKFNFSVPKRDLISNLQVLYQAKKIKIAKGIKDADTLVKELLNFKVKISTSGHDSYEAWREGSHDDLVLSVALACWYHERDKVSNYIFPGTSSLEIDDIETEDKYSNY
jgi:hypothetical protein